MRIYHDSIRMLWWTLGEQPALELYKSLSLTEQFEWWNALDEKVKNFLCSKIFIL